MAPVLKQQSSFDNNIEDTISEPRELLYQTSRDLRKTIVKKIWMVNATKRVRSFLSQQRSLNSQRRSLNRQQGNLNSQQEVSENKNQRCSPEEIQTLVNALPRHF